MRKQLIQLSIIIFLLTLCVPTNLFAENLLDSLLLPFTRITGEKQFENLNQQILELKEEEPEKAIAYANEGLKLASQGKNVEWEAAFLVISAELNTKKGLIGKSSQQLQLAIPLFQALKDPVGVAKVWAKLGINHYVVNDLDHGLEYLKKAETIFESIQDHSELYLVINNIGNIYRAKTDYAEALKYYEKAILICETNNLSDNAFFAKGNKAFILHKIGNSVEALQIYFEILNLLRKVERIVQIGLIYHHIANLLEETQLLEEAIPYYYNAIEAYSKCQNSDYLSSAYMGLGELVLKQEKFEKASYYFKKGLEIKQNSETKMLGLPFYHLGELNLKQKKYKEALSFFNKSLSNFMEYKNKRGIDMIDTKFGIIYLKTNELEKAEKYLLKACLTEENSGRIRDTEIVYKSLYEVYQLKGNYRKALTYQQKLQIVKDSLYSIENLQKINRQLLKEALSEKEFVLDSLRRSAIKIQDQNNYLENLFSKIVKWQYGFVFFSICVLILLIWKWAKFRIKQKSTLTKLSQNINVQQKLNELINTKNKDINTLSVKLISKTQIINKLKEILQKENGSSLSKSNLHKLLHSMQTEEMLQQDWNYFHDMFNEVFSEFFTHFSNTYTSLSKKDLRLCGLIRSNLSPIEISEILGISLESVHSARYRLRKKIKLTRKDNLDQFIQNF